MCEEFGAETIDLATLTPAMVAAGVEVLTGSGRVEFDLPDWAARELVQDILLAVLPFVDRNGKNPPVS